MRFVRLLWLAVWAVFFYSTTAGCNGILGNEEGFLVSGTPMPDASEDVAPDQGAVTPAPDASGDASPCPFGKKVCAGGCVDVTGWQVGCGGADCKACNANHASAVACLPGVTGEELVCTPSCEDGWANCDGDPANGCETDLSKRDHCGACGTACTGANGLCAAKDNDFVCVDVCPPGTTQCGNECPNTDTSETHCGGCDKPCVGGQGSSGRCAAGSCSVVCNVGHGRCGPSLDCYLESDVTHCGGTNVCRDCTKSIPPNAVLVGCASDACVFQCAPPTVGTIWLDCNGNVNTPGSDGCETNGWSNDTRCGSCTRVCSSSGTIDAGGPTDAGGGPDASAIDGATLDGAQPDGDKPDAQQPTAGEYCCHDMCVSTMQSCF